MSKTSKFFSAAVCVWALTVLCASSAMASGFALYEWSARGNAMGNAVMTNTTDASIIAYNPAAMTNIEGHSIVAGTSVLLPGITVERAGVEQDLKSQVFWDPHAYYAGKITDKVWVGIGEFTRFGTGNKYPEQWGGSVAPNFGLYNGEMRSFSITPVIAFKATEDLSVSFGGEILHGEVDYWTGLGKTYASDTTVGFNTSLLYKITEDVKFGMMYRSSMDLTGQGDFNPSSTGFAMGMKDGDMTMRATLPASTSFSLGWEATDDLRFEADAVYTEWSDFSQFLFQYDPSIGAPVAGDKYSYKDFADVWRLSIGAEYDLNDQWAVRGGYIFDESPINDMSFDYMIPGNDRHILSTGLGYKIGSWTIDTSYQAVFMKDRDDIKVKEAAGTVNVNTTNGLTHVFGLTVGYSF
ncbi:MAG: OmpP1/FadL family transporter [Desulfovibrio sp.]